jgi:hypothetical protein
MEDELDFSRLKQGEIIAGLGGIALFFFLFLDWFGAGDAGASGWDSLGDVTGLIVFVAAIAGIKLAGMAAMGLRLNIGLQRGVITTAVAWLATVAIIRTIFATPEGADVKFGLILGLLAALAITGGAFLALRENGFEPVVAVAGGRTKAVPATSSASAPAATPRRAASASKSSGSKTTARKTTSTRSKSSGSSRSTSTRKRSSTSRKK